MEKLQIEKKYNKPVELILDTAVYPRYNKEESFITM
jgi:hypothetical protein